MAPAILPALRRRGIGAAVAAALIATVAGTAAAYARFSAITGNPGNAVAAATLAAPGAPTSVHPNVTGASAGSVNLTWTPSATAWTQSYLVSRAPATAGSPTWATVATVASSACAATCVYTDSTAQYGQQYLYRVQAIYSSWSAAAAVDMALSLTPATSSPAGTSGDTTKPGLAEYSLPSAGSQPGQVAGGGTGDANVYFVEQGGARLGRMSTSGALVELLLQNGWRAWGVTVDTADANNVYFTENGPSASKVGRLALSKLNATACTSLVTGGQITYAGLTSAPCSALTEWTVSTVASADLRGIAGDSGAVYFAEYATSKIGGITISTGTLTEAALASGAAPVGVTIPASDTGNLYFTESGANKIGRVKANSSLGSLKETAAVAGLVPWGIAGGPDINVYVAGSGSGAIVSVPTGFGAAAIPSALATLAAGSAPAGIALGPDSNLWFAESGTARIGMVTTTGVVTEYSTPAAASTPLGVAKGPDGSVWFTESAAGANRVGAVRFSATYALAAADVTALATDDSSSYQTQAWAATASTGTYTQALTLVPATPVVPAGGAAVGTVRVVLDYQLPPVTQGQTNITAGVRIGISADGGATYTRYALPNPQAAPPCPNPGGGATESCTLSGAKELVVLTVPASVVGTTAQLAAMVVQLQAAPGSGNAFTMSVDLAHVDVN